MKNKVLIIDDDISILSLFDRYLSKEPYDLICMNSCIEALEILDKEEIALIISDENMPGMTGSEFFEIAKEKYPEVIRIILTGFANLESVIRTINKCEVYRFFTKPCNLDDLKTTIRQAIELRDLKMKNQELTWKLKEQSKTIEILEKHQPGITMVKRDKNGNVIL